MEMFLDQQVPANSPLLQQAYRNYEENLQDTIAVAEAAGVKVIVATVATNLKDCAPFASMHRKDLQQDDLKRWSGFVQRGSEIEEQKPAEALKQYQSAASIDSEYAELEFRIARCFSRLGDYKASKEHFTRARDLDTLRFRADSRINEINRSVATAQHVPIVDAEEILSDAAPDTTIGSDQVYEHVHMTPEGNYLLARAAFLQIAPNLPPSQSAVPEPLSEAECEQRLALTGFDRWRLMAEMFGRLQKAPFTTQLNHSEQIFRFVAGAQPPSENPNDTVAQYQWAIAHNPDDPMLHLRFGGFLFPYNRAAAAEQIGMAQPWDGYPMFLPDGTQIR